MVVCRLQLIKKGRCVVKRQHISVKCQQRNFDEGAAEVKRLLKRDRKELNILENNLESEFGGSAEIVGNSEFEVDSDGVSDSQVDTSNRTLSPFGEGFRPQETRFAPFGEDNYGLSPRMQPDPVVREPWWAFLKKITIGQLVLVVTFSSMIALMFATFSVVLKSGGISFNE